MNPRLYMAAGAALMCLFLLAFFLWTEYRAYKSGMLQHERYAKHIRALSDDRNANAKNRREKALLIQHNQRLVYQWRVRWIVNHLLVLSMLVVVGAAIAHQVYQL